MELAWGERIRATVPIVQQWSTYRSLNTISSRLEVSFEAPALKSNPFGGFIDHFEFFKACPICDSVEADTPQSAVHAFFASLQERTRVLAKNEDSVP